MFAGGDTREPRLSICIPTYRRMGLLIEAVRSAVAQDWNAPFEIVVVDNDPGSPGAAPLLEAIPSLAQANFRYFVNAENLGMFGNWNRSIELARSEWYTMLHDDDLLRSDFASRMMAAITRDRRIEGITCRRQLFGSKGHPQRSFKQQLQRHAGTLLRFGVKPLRRYRADRFFWSAYNPVGFIARRRDLIALGGYQPSEYPMSDHYLQLRFAVKHRLVELKEYLVDIRVLENESMRPDVALRMIAGFHLLRQEMAGAVVPRWWAHFSGLMLERQRQLSLFYTGEPMSREAVEKAAGIPLPRDRPRILALVKGLLRGY
jgi:glycosyltransferase involved in cell wall biosynthesis